MRDGNELRRQRDNYDPSEIRRILDDDKPIASTRTPSPRINVSPTALPAWNVRKLPIGRRKPNVPQVRFSGEKPYDAV
jgi:hypothetical protein